MAIAIGNKTASNLNPNASSQTLSHNQNTGSNRTLLVVVTMANTVNFTGCTYNGTSMTLVRNHNFTGLSQRQAAYVLQNPDTGANNIVVSFSGSQFNSTSIFAVSFTGAGGVGNDGVNGTSTTPHSQNITISANSIIYATGISNTAQSTDYDIAGSTRTAEFNGHNTNKIVEGALSATGLTAGSKSVVTKCDSGDVTNYRIEIQEAAATGSSSGSFLMFFD